MATTQRELFARLLKGFTGYRKPGDDISQRVNPQGNVIFMIGECMRYVPTMCQSRFWPRLFELLDAGKDHDAFMEQLKLCQHAVWEMLKVTDLVAPSADDIVDENLGESLSRVGWDKLDERARVAYMATLGYYMLAGVWTVSKQDSAIGKEAGHAFDTVLAAAGECFRMTDQHIDPAGQAAELVRSTVTYALLLGLSREDIAALVSKAMLEPKEARLPTGLSQFGQLAKLPQETEDRRGDA